jgi:tripartite-type tricarboxylate transporter receptor subunit TctC
MGAERLRTLPDVPTMIESGLPRMVATSWLGVLAPANLPRDVRDTLSNAIVEIAGSEANQAKLHAVGLEPAKLGADEFSAFYQKEVRKWSQVVADRHIRIPN